MTAKRRGARAGASVSRPRPSRATVRTKHPQKYVLMLYVAGVDRKSTQAIRAVAKLCDEHLKGRCRLVIVDIYQHPRLARGKRIIAAPTLIRTLPLPLRRVVGNMADLDKVLVGLDRRPAS